MNLKDTTLNEIHRYYRLNGFVCPAAHNSSAEIRSVMIPEGGDLGGDWIMRAEPS